MPAVSDAEEWKSVLESFRDPLVLTFKYTFRLHLVCYTCLLVLFLFYLLSFLFFLLYLA